MQMDTPSSVSCEMQVHERQAGQAPLYSILSEMEITLWKNTAIAASNIAEIA